MTRVFASASHRQYEQPSGLTFPGVFALLTKRHMYEHGTTDEQLAHVAVKNHANGKLNPRAHFGRDVTTDEVLESPIVADPFHLLDCCPFSDGAAAAVVTSADLEGSLDGEAVDVTGVGHATDIVPLADKVHPSTTQAARDAASEAYEQAGIEGRDVDLGAGRALARIRGTVEIGDRVALTGAMEADGHPASVFESV